ncbi:MAG: hydrogenase maturation nickel metallochaperone HypA [Candidatus Omnitrophica bacterium]|nr:hydrogenase maturation nickel metallochaperone HypA [Candidatus Omnitrophota bacterium]
MHETVFANEILAFLKRVLTQESVRKKIVVNVKLSPFSHVSPENLAEAFNNLISDTEFKGTKIVIMPLEILAKCKKCKNISSITRKGLNCQKCGSDNLELNVDKEFYIESIELHEE